MLRKNFFKLLFISIFLLGFASNATKADVQNIRMDYCENLGKKTTDDSKLITTNPWEEKEICLNFSSNEVEEVNITYWFTEWIFNGRWTQICNANFEEPNWFSRFFSNDNWNIRKIALKPGEHKIIKEKITVPLWISWMVYGCLMHKIDEAKSNKMFTVVAVIKRKLNIFVWWNSEISKWISILKNKGNIFSTNPKIWAKITNNGKMTLTFTVKNHWNISQNISITWTMINALWFEKIFETKPILVGPWKEINIPSQELLLPAYKWFFNIESKLTATPIFDFNADSLDAKIKEPKTFIETWTIFIFSRVWIIVAIVAILILVLILRPLFKKHKE